MTNIHGHLWSVTDKKVQERECTRLERSLFNFFFNFLHTLLNQSFDFVVWSVSSSGLTNSGLTSSPSSSTSLISPSMLSLSMLSPLPSTSLSSSTSSLRSSLSPSSTFCKLWSQQSYEWHARLYSNFITESRNIFRIILFVNSIRSRMLGKLQSRAPLD